MIVPYQQLSPEALQGLIEAYIAREGTDYGELEYNLADKVAQVMGQLRSGEVVIAFDESSESVNILLRREAESLL